jgi:hypothetical protein
MFVDRGQEIAWLEEGWESDKAQLRILYGRLSTQFKAIWRIHVGDPAPQEQRQQAKSTMSTKCSRSTTMACSRLPTSSRLLGHGWCYSLTRRSNR